MKRARIISFLTVVSVGLSGCVIALADPPPDNGGFWRIMDTRKVGAAQFIKKHPNWDGRGAVIAVLDTGVDMGVPGLVNTSTGKTKVIEARDFTGQGDVVMLETRVEVVDKLSYLVSEEGRVKGYGTLPIKPRDNDWQLGFLEETRFKNGAVSDFNLNGHKGDRFAILTAKGKSGWVAYIDRDGDGDITNAKPIHSYHQKHQGFTFVLGNPKVQQSPVTFAIEIEDGGSAVNFHFDDGGHGTHVAGIAAGYNMMSRKGFNGIAPGAEVMSLKIGDNTLAGGSTTTDSMRRAIEYAGTWSNDNKRPVVINMSYGIGSEIEGESDIDILLDDMLAKYPLLAASVSAGNEGPGLSTVGTPAASRLAVTAAAMLPKEASSSMFGTRISQDKVFSFSSRGGELAKPDVLAPGIASATTPTFDKGDIKGGTSMAAPQIAGVQALMVSAALASKTRFTGATLKRALVASAKPIRGYSPIAQGAGVPNVELAVNYLKKLAGRKEPFKVVGYSVTTKVPTSDSGSGHAAYWRAGTFLPSFESGHTFKIEPMFPQDTTGKQRTGFQTMFTFRSDTPWLRVDRGNGRLTGKRPLKIKVSYKSAALKKPGVYTGRVLVYTDDGAGIPAFSLWNTVVVPHTFDLSNYYSLKREKQRLEPGDFQRFPVLVPPGASHMNISINTPKGRWGRTILEVYDPRGRPYPVSDYIATSSSSRTARVGISGRALMPGIWEVIPYGSFRNRSTTHYNLNVHFRGIEAQTITGYTQKAGKTPEGWFEVTNRYDTRFSGKVSGSIIGYGRTRTREVEDDTLEESLHMNSEISRVELVLRLSSRTYNRFTDVPITVTDSSGKAFVKSGFVNGIARVSIPNRGKVTLQIRGGFAKSGGDPWKISIQETYVRRNAVSVSVGHSTLYPNVPANLKFKLSTTPPQAPRGFANVGHIIFTDDHSKEVWLKLPMKLD